MAHQFETEKEAVLWLTGLGYEPATRRDEFEPVEYHYLDEDFDEVCTATVYTDGKGVVNVYIDSKPRPVTYDEMLAEVPPQWRL